MFKSIMGSRKASDTALKALIASVLVAALLAIPHAYFEGRDYGLHEGRDFDVMIATLIGDTRYLFEQLLYVSALIFVGAKFFETRTTFAVTFDRVDAAKLAVKGPDDDNVVWIGQRYGNKMEADIVAATLENRLRENAS